MDGVDSWEQLPARRLADRRFILCCVPFFARNLALGDEVETADQPEHPHVVASVVVHSGHFAYRVILKNAAEPARQMADHPFLRALNNIGCVYERASPRLIGIDAENADIAERLCVEMASWEATGDIEWEAANDPI